jgi:hypothetical protein
MPRRSGDGLCAQAGEVDNPITQNRRRHLIPSLLKAVR